MSCGLNYLFAWPYKLFTDFCYTMLYTRQLCLLAFSLFCSVIQLAVCPLLLRTGQEAREVSFIAYIHKLIFISLKGLNSDFPLLLLQLFKFFNR